MAPGEVALPVEWEGDPPQASILLVDDRPENLAALQAVLDPLGQNLRLASSGAEALKWLLQEDFALVLLDAQMPGMDGFETAQLIRQREKTRHLPIIFLTAYSKDQQHVSQGYSVGAVDYITKPFDVEILRAKVRIFVELYHRGEQIKRQAQRLHEIKMQEAERKERERAAAREQEQIRALNAVLESRVAERTAQLLEANEEMEAFCYSVSHDLRAPLRAVMSTSKMLIEEAQGKLSPEELGLLQRQSAVAKRLGDLIDDLLNLSRLGRQSLDKRDLDLTKMARTVAAEVLQAGYPATIVVEENLRCHADPGLVRVLLQNLLENAGKYSPNGGTIHFGAIREDDHDVFFVKDEGIGFSMDYRHKLFLPFERLVLEDEYPGTGIGLASVKRIISRHGGKVWAEGVPGHGATFFFTL